MNYIFIYLPFKKNYFYVNGFQPLENGYMTRTRGARLRLALSLIIKPSTQRNLSKGTAHQTKDDF